MPEDTGQRAECLSWFMWGMSQSALLGGAFGHFYNYGNPNRTAAHC